MVGSPAVSHHRSMDSDLRRDGARHVRRVSNWAAAALIAGTGAAAVAFAHQALPAAGTGSANSSVTGAGSGAASTGTATRTGGPRVSNPVATTTASGVTTITRIVNGKTVVTQTRSAPPRGGDD